MKVSPLLVNPLLGYNIGLVVQNKYYIGKNQTKWKKEVPPQNSRTRSHNIIIHIYQGINQKVRMKNLLFFSFL